MSEREKKTGRPPPPAELAEELLEHTRKMSLLIQQEIQLREELVTIAFKLKGSSK